MSPESALGPVTQLAGVGPARAEALARIGVRSIRDLLFLIPRRLEAWTDFVPIAEAREKVGEEVRVRGSVRSVRHSRSGWRRSLVRVKVGDESATIDAMFFNQPWLAKNVTVGQPLELFGRVVDSKGPALASPKMGSVAKPLPEAGRLEPEYAQVEGVGSGFLRDLCRAAVERFADSVTDPLERETLAAHELPALADALRELHTPNGPETFEAARRRLTFERLLRLQARSWARRRARRAGVARECPVDDSRHAELVARFPFQLTGGQRDVLEEVRGDIARSVPMRRLLQGDVGAGKTVIGVYAAMAAADAGCQIAFMAPTELLCEQHFDGMREMLEEAGLRADVLVGSLHPRQRRDVLQRLELGLIDILFGTHSLFSDDVKYKQLGLAIVDEQHRFGVAQRERLFDKGRDVHVLLMTATPIPRTLAMTLYADLDVSVLREKPPGRGSVETRWLRGKDLERLPHFLAERLGAGEQVYWVCPRIESGDEESKLASAEDVFESVSRSSLAEHGVELVHGRLDRDLRSEALDRFRRAEVRILVATTVIEVGVDVPAATVMIVENAERLGLAQLHQLRGRIGRGAGDSWCLLRGKSVSAERFRVLEKTNDGFELAEEDLRKRGMGDLSGLRQAGVNTEGLDDLAEHVDLFIAARDLCAKDEVLATLYLEQDEAGHLATP